MRAVRVMLTAVMTRCAIWLARGPSSRLKNTCSHAPRLTSIRAASSRKVRPNSPSLSREVRFRKILRKLGTRRRSCPSRAGWSAAAIRDEYVAQSPDRLDKYRLGRIGFDQLAQTRNLHVQAAIEGFVFAAAGQFHQFVAGQGNLGVARKHLQDREF